MIYTINNITITDDTSKCDNNTYFLKTTQNEKYQHALKDAKGILCVSEVFEKWNIDKNIKIIGITGTNGKTTSAACIYSIMCDLGKSVALQGTRGFYINDKNFDEKSLTTPPILQTLYHLHQANTQKCEFFIIEVSSHAIVQNRIDGLKFALKVFTNISQDHLDFHKSMQEYTNVKSSFFADESLKLINKDDKQISYNIKGARTYGIENIATYKVLAYTLKNGIDAVICKNDKIFTISSTLRGFFNLYNLTCAISAVDILLDVEPKDMQDAVENFAGVSGRMELLHVKPTVIVDFAHTPDGMQKVFEALKHEKIIVVFGAGGNRDNSKRPIMGKMAQKYANKIYITSDNPRDEEPSKILEQITNGISNMQNVQVIQDRKQAILEALANLNEDEILLILGKGDETYQEIKGVKYPFDDREIVRDFYKY